MMEWWNDDQITEPPFNILPLRYSILPLLHLSTTPGITNVIDICYILREFLDVVVRILIRDWERQIPRLS